MPVAGTMCRSGTASLMRATRRTSCSRPSTVGSTMVRMPAPASWPSLVMASATRDLVPLVGPVGLALRRQHEDVLVHERPAQLRGGHRSPHGLHLLHGAHGVSPRLRPVP